jgi:hypothetical protein
MWVDHKELEMIRGFLIYTSHTNPPLTPLLKGLHLIIDVWSPDREEEGWWQTQSELDATKELDEDSENQGVL